MSMVLAVLAVVFIIAGFFTLIGGITGLAFWALAGLCIVLAWKLRPRRLVRREDRHGLGPDR